MEAKSATQSCILKINYYIKNKIFHVEQTIIVGHEKLV